MHHTRTIGVLAAGLVLLATACSPRTDDTFPESIPFEPDVLDELHEIRERASAARDLSRNPETSEGAISPSNWRRYIRESCDATDDEARRSSAEATLAWQLLGVLGGDDDLFEDSCGYNASGWAGFYSFEEDRLILIGAPDRIDEWDEATLVHEYVHSFQETLIDRDEWDALEQEMGQNGTATEYGTTLSCLMEGDASVSEVVYDEAMGAWPSYYADYWAGFADEEWTAETPAWMVRYYAFNYRQCALMAERVYLQGGWDAVNALYQEPPATTEQVLHPEKLESREKPLTVPDLDISDRLGGDWELMDSGVFGEFDAWNLVGSVTRNDRLAEEASTGWGGGRLAMYRLAASKNPEVTVTLVLAWDTEEDADQFVSAFERVASSRGTVRDVADGFEWAGANVNGQLRQDGAVTEIVVSSMEDAVAAGMAALQDPETSPRRVEDEEGEGSLPVHPALIGAASALAMALLVAGTAFWWNNRAKRA
jgi:hypothetical protein